MKKITMIGISLLLIGLVVLGVSGYSAIKSGGVQIKTPNFMGMNMLGFSNDKAEEVTKELSDGRIESLDVELQMGAMEYKYGNVAYPTLSYQKILRGDTLRYDVVSEIKNGKLTIRDKYSENFDILNFGTFKLKPLVLTLPEKYSIKDINIKMQMGSLNAESIVTDNIAIDLNMGSANIKASSIGSLTSTLDMGSFTIVDSKIMGSNITLNMGSFKSNATLKGTHKIKCDMGSINLSLDENPGAFNYDVTVQAGSFKINGVKPDNKRLNDPKNNLNLILDVEMGSIDIQAKF